PLPAATAGPTAPPAARAAVAAGAALRERTPVAGSALRSGAAEAPFIPPQPVPAPHGREPMAAPEPFAAAAFANGVREDKPAAKPAATRPSLFHRMTGGGRLKESKEARPKALVAEKPKNTPVQGSFDNLSPPAAPKPGIEEDFLDIPAFLRRQAN
ncbi:MAG TPA: hypothetical protein VJN41_08145, partial [Alphaproteobacteria bacterium]|nr:hypothetical protein [Alphaproteobacteria bacterium]